VVGEDITGWIMLKMNIGAGCHGFHGVICKWILYPTLFYRTAENIGPKEFFKLPYPVFFDIFIFPDTAAK
jgi:hypothetical protein